MYSEGLYVQISSPLAAIKSGEEFSKGFQLYELLWYPKFGSYSWHACIFRNLSKMENESMEAI